MILTYRAIVCAFLLGAWSSIVVADDAGDAYFKQNVEPLLKKYCFECHSHASSKTKGWLSLDLRNGWTVGGATGPAVVPGKPEASLLIKAVSYSDKELTMPPKEIVTITFSAASIRSFLMN